MKTYGKPVLLWCAALVGLVVALLADGVVEALATALTALPLVVIALKLRSARTPREEKAKLTS